MKTAYLALLVIAVPLSTVACTQTTVSKVPTIIVASSPAMSKQSHTDGYIVTAQDEASVRLVYAKQGIKMLRTIGNGQFELHLQSDPGLAELNELAAHSSGVIRAIQPNYRYQTN